MNSSRNRGWIVWCLLVNLPRYCSISFLVSAVLLFDCAGAKPPTRGLEIGQQLSTTQQDANAPGATVPSKRLRIGQQSVSGSGQTNMTLAKQATQALTEGVQLYKQGTVESVQKAIKKLQEAVKLWREARDQRGEAYSLMFLGLAYNNDNVGEKHKALDCYNQALGLFRVVGDGGNGGEASTLTSIGTLYDDLGNKQKALGFYNQALLLAQSMKDLDKEVIILNSIGKVYFNWGRKDKALEFFNKASSLSQRSSAWTLITTETKDYSIPTYYDKNSVTRTSNGDVVLVRIAAKNKEGFLRLTCSRHTLATSANGRNFDSPRQISPNSSAGVLYQMFCH